MTAKPRGYLPALRFRALTPLYDRVLRVLMPPEHIHARLIYQASPQNGERVLHLGCGAGTFVLAIKRACPEARVVGIDEDPEAIAVARRDAADAGLDIELRHASAAESGCEEGSFSIVFASLMFRHFTTRQKMRTLVNAYGLLSPGGELHVLDWSRARGPLMEMMRLVPFREIREVDGHMSLRGTMSTHRARR